MEKSMKNSLILLLPLFLIMSCASIVKGTNQQVKIDSEPTAQIQVIADSGQVYYEGKVPTSIKLPKKNSYTVKFTKDGYEGKTVPITQSFETWYIGNLLCGGIPGFVVDAVTGAMYKLEPNHINVNLAEVTTTRGEKTEYLVFQTYDQNGDLRTMLVPIERAL